MKQGEQRAARIVSVQDDLPSNSISIGPSSRFGPIGAIALISAIIAGGIGIALDSRISPLPAAAQEAPRELVVDVKSAHPHDQHSYTQGLLFHEGRLFESAGKRLESDVREVDLRTGEVLRERELADEYFAEGLAAVGDRLIQLTWESGIAFVYDIHTFDPLDSFTYEGEGWGLCYDGERLVMSDGGPSLEFRDPETFEVLGEVPVTMAGVPLNDLNELECVDGGVYANVWTKTFIVRIDPATGIVTHRIDASALDNDFRSRTGNLDTYDTLNGIAYDPASDLFFLTGKYWDQIYGVRFVPRSVGTPIAIPTVDTAPTPTLVPEALFAPFARKGR